MNSGKCSTKSWAYFNCQPMDVNIFNELGVSNKMCDSLTAEKIFIPTLVQYESLPLTLCSNRNCIIQSATGSGKSLTFLIPSLQDESSGLHSLIVVPSRELAIQLEYQARKLMCLGNLSQNLLSICAGSNLNVVIKHNAPPNIIIGTPKIVLELVKSGSLRFNSLNRVVLDEVDKLLPSASKYKKSSHVHLKPARRILRELVQFVNPQYIATSATISKDIINDLVHVEWGDDSNSTFIFQQRKSISIPQCVKHGYITKTESPKLNKLDMLVKYLKKGVKAMVVIHRYAPISRFVHELKLRDVNAIPLHENTFTSEAYHRFLQQCNSGM